MAQVWMRARKDFTHRTWSYHVGDLFQVPTLVAVQLIASRSAESAKAPALVPTETPATVEDPPAPTPRRRGRPPRIMTAAPVAAAEPDEAPTPEPVVAQVTELAFPNPNPVVEVDLSPGTYARKDLRAED